MEENLDQISAIAPIHFFSITADLMQCEWKKPLTRKHELPHFSQMLSEHNYSSMKMGWHEKGLAFEVEVKHPFQECYFPEFRKGDCIELFIDTRDLKTAGFPTKFCHHFVFFPKPLEGIHGREVTSFRTEDKHQLMDPSLFIVKSDFKKKGYQMQILLPKESLYGYDPLGFDRMGFTYRINAQGKFPNHFVVSSDDVQIENHPSRWTTMIMR